MPIFRKKIRSGQKDSIPKYLNLCCHQQEKPGTNPTLFLNPKNGNCSDIEYYKNMEQDVSVVVEQPKMELLSMWIISNQEVNSRNWLHRKATPKYFAMRVIKEKAIFTKLTGDNK